MPWALVINVSYTLYALLVINVSYTLYALMLDMILWTYCSCCCFISVYSESNLGERYFTCTLH